jgi:SAM-dependent methyltransferase
MRVQRDFEGVYAQQADPWCIGDADSDRYDLYRELILEHAHCRGSILDIGSGFGAFLARFRDDFDEAVAVELVAAAIDVGHRRYPWIRFSLGSADALDDAGVGERRYDAIIFSDVIYYLDNGGKSRSLDWIGSHLQDGGVALVAAYCPGGHYLTTDELSRMVRSRFAIEAERRLDSGHAVLVARRRRRRIAVTLEEASPRVLGLLASAGLSATLFPDVDRYLSLLERDPAAAETAANSWREATRHGHEVQLRLDPEALDGDWSDTLERRVSALRRAIEPANPEYQVRCVRMSAKPPEPFQPLYDALAAAGIDCDSTCTATGRRQTWAGHQPYCLGRYDMRLKGPPAEDAMVELPVSAAFRIGHQSLAGSLPPSSAPGRPVSATQLRRTRRLRAIGRHAYRLRLVRRARLQANRVLPRRLAHAIVGCAPARLVQDEYVVLAGDARQEPSDEAVRRWVAELEATGDLATLSAMAGLARADLIRTASVDRTEAER